MLHEIRGEGLLDAMNTGQAAVMWHSTVGMAPPGRASAPVLYVGDGVEMPPCIGVGWDMTLVGRIGR